MSSLSHSFSQSENIYVIQVLTADLHSHDSPNTARSGHCPYTNSHSRTCPLRNFQSPSKRTCPLLSYRLAFYSIRMLLGKGILFFPVSVAQHPLNMGLGGIANFQPRQVSLSPNPKGVLAFRLNEESATPN